ncbi:MAG: hypothetical protein M3217_12045, partial [Actinomycetota bacterium]|nr:hypothetical protein [Actinomycetota bacterium]
SDPNSAKAVYTSLFGWQAEDLEAAGVGIYSASARRQGSSHPLHAAAGGASGGGAAALDLLDLSRGRRRDCGYRL